MVKNTDLASEIKDSIIKEYGKNDEYISVKDSLAIKLLKLRELSGLTQKQLSDYSGISVNRISKFERDSSTPNIDDMERMRPFLGFSYEKLLMNQSVENIGIEAKLGLSHQAFSWLCKEPTDSIRMTMLNNLFEDSENIELILDAMFEYVLSAYTSMPKSGIKGLFQYDTMEVVQKKSIDAICSVLDLLLDERWVLENKSSVLYEIAVKEAFKLNRISEDFEERVKERKRKNARKRRRLQEQELADFAKEAKEHEGNNK